VTTVRVAHDPSGLPAVGPRVVTIGNFDGVHLGHRAILRTISRQDITSTVITFDPHPRAYFGGPLPEISTLARRIELLSMTGVDEILVLPFDATMAALEPECWVRRYLEPLDVRQVVVGEQFRFGRDRAGDIGLLRAMGLDVQPVPLVPGVSSTRVRELVDRGDLSQAARLLGRDHEIEGIVVGSRPGRRAVTLELEPAVATAVMPPRGRYAARIDRDPVVLDRPSDRPDLRVQLRAWQGAVGARLRVALNRPLPAAGST